MKITSKLSLNTLYIIFTLLFLWMMSGSIAASTIKALSPLPEKVKHEWANFNLIGQTRLHRYGFHIYDSSFWSTNRPATDSEIKDYLQLNTSALSITYARTIRAEQLLSSTKKEWQRLGYAKQYPLEAWLKILENIWPNVVKGDQLVIVTTPQGRSTFYSKDKSLGTIEDPDFGPAFLAIWLDEKSRYKKNRQELLGEK